MRGGKIPERTMETLCGLLAVAVVIGYYLGVGDSWFGHNLHRTPEQIHRVVHGLSEKVADQGTNPQGCRYVDYTSEFGTTAVCIIMRGQSDNVAQVNVVFDPALDGDWGIMPDVVAAVSDRPVNRDEVLGWIRSNKDGHGAKTTAGSVTLELTRGTTSGAGADARVLQVY